MEELPNKIKEKPKFFMYWEGNIKRLQGNINKWKHLNQDEYECVLFNKNSALEYITTHFTKRYIDAYNKCAVPAMRSDYFRLSALAHENNIVYIDCNFKPLKSLKQVGYFVEGRTTLFYKKDPTKLINGAVSNLGNQKWKSIFIEIFELATQNIENEAYDNVWKITGPFVWRTIRNKHKDSLEGDDEPILVDFWLGNPRFMGMLIKKGKIKCGRHWSKINEKENIFNKIELDSESQDEIMEDITEDITEEIIDD